MRRFSIILFVALLSAALCFASPPPFGGVGIDGVPQADGQIVVRQLVTGGPAHLAGIRVGDVITHIDSKPTKGNDFKQMVTYRLRGKAGTKVLITLRRPGEARPLHFTLTRRQLLAPRK